MNWFDRRPNRLPWIPIERLWSRLDFFQVRGTLLPSPSFSRSLVPGANGSSLDNRRTRKSRSLDIGNEICALGPFPFTMWLVRADALDQNRPLTVFRSCRLPRFDNTVASTLEFMYFADPSTNAKLTPSPACQLANPNSICANRRLGLLPKVFKRSSEYR